MLDGIPLPGAIAARPRDQRGYPALAITPWENGEPRFAATGTARTFICAAERRCSVCGTPMPPGPVWRVVAGPEADAMAAAREEGRPYLNRAATQEAPGHRTCMLFAAMVCPYLARPNARRAAPTTVPGLDAARGTARGLGGAVAGFDEYEAGYRDGRVLFRFSGLREFLKHDLGAEHLDALTEAVAAEPDCPAVAAAQQLSYVILLVDPAKGLEPATKSFLDDASAGIDTTVAVGPVGSVPAGLVGQAANAAAGPLGSTPADLSYVR